MHMNDQNVHNYGDNNVSNQYNGDVSLTSLNLDELAEEYKLARHVVRRERNRRLFITALCAILTLLAIMGIYLFFLNRGDLEIADVFNNFATSLSVPLVGMVVSALLALFLGGTAVEAIRKPTRVEKSNRDRLPLIEDIVISKGYSRRDWAKAKAKESSQDSS